tara:strand:- start:8937 stop:9515 length:579 start_codon:yes stop_codon:yes gene_type:complete
MTHQATMTTSMPSLNIIQTLSVYIPSVSIEHANYQYFYDVFNTLNIGMVKRVDFQPKNDSPTFMAFVHMVKWYENEAVMNLQEKILNEDPNIHEARIVHDDPDYWVIKPNKNPIPDNYAEELAQVKLNMGTLMSVINKQSETINSLSETIKSVQYMNQVHDANIKILINALQQQDSWDNRLRKRKTSLKYDN